MAAENSASPRSGTTSSWERYEHLSLHLSEVDRQLLCELDLMYPLFSYQSRSAIMRALAALEALDSLPPANLLPVPGPWRLLPVPDPWRLVFSVKRRLIHDFLVRRDFNRVPPLSVVHARQPVILPSDELSGVKVCLERTE